MAKVGVLALQGAFREHREVLDALGVETVEVLARHEDVPVLARQNRVVVASFHPELSGDLRLHEWFLHGIERDT